MMKKRKYWIRSIDGTTYAKISRVLIQDYMYICDGFHQERSHDEQHSDLPSLMRLKFSIC